MVHYECLVADFDRADTRVGSGIGIDRVIDGSIARACVGGVKPGIGGGRGIGGGGGPCGGSIGGARGVPGVSISWPPCMNMIVLGNSLPVDSPVAQSIMITSTSQTPSK